MNSRNELLKKVFDKLNENGIYMYAWENHFMIQTLQRVTSIYGLQMMILEQHHQF